MDVPDLCKDHPVVRMHKVLDVGNEVFSWWGNQACEDWERLPVDRRDMKEDVDTKHRCPHCRDWNIGLIAVDRILERGNPTLELRTFHSHNGG